MKISDKKDRYLLHQMQNSAYPTDLLCSLAHIQQWFGDNNAVACAAVCHSSRVDQKLQTKSLYTVSTNVACIAIMPWKCFTSRLEKICLLGLFRLAFSHDHIWIKTINKLHVPSSKITPKAAKLMQLAPQGCPTILKTILSCIFHTPFNPASIPYALLVAFHSPGWILYIHYQLSLYSHHSTTCSLTANCRSSPSWCSSHQRSLVS